MNGFARAAAGYACAGVLSLAILVPVLRLWRADLRVPFEYHDDTLFTLASVKGTLDNGWYLHNPLLGAPYGLDLRDWPVAESLHFAAVKALGWLCPDAVAVCGLYFLLSFPLTTLSALFVLRRFGVNYPAALSAGLLYTFLPYHFLHGENHLFISAYYVVPPLVLVVLWVWTDAFAAAPRRRGALALGACVLAGCASVYYAFFGCFFLLTAGVAGAWRQRKPRLLATACLLTCTLAAVVVVNVLPCLLYRASEGANSMVPRRTPVESEIHGLKMVQLLLPVTGHRFPPFREFKATYNDWVPEGENDYVSLGLAGGAGLVFLLARMLVPRPEARGRALVLEGLALLTVCGLLLAAVGGAGGVFFLVVTRMIRAYGRISVFLAFFALLALAIVADRLYRRHAFTPRRRAAFAALCALLVPAGVLDQTSKAFVPAYDRLREEVGGDADFVRAIEERVPPGTMVFQLPFIEAPETPGVRRVGPYDPYRGYIHSRRLRWSHGAMIGREGSYRLQALARLPLEEMVEALVLAGYGGLWVDRHGYADDGEVVESGLACMTGRQPLVSAHGRFSFFPLDDCAERLNRQYSPQEQQARREELLEQVVAGWQGDFCQEETDAGGCRRWCGPAGRLLLFNPSAHERRVTLRFGVAAADIPSRRPPRLTVRGLAFQENRELSPVPVPLTQDVVLPPGKSVIEFACDGPVHHLDHCRRVFQVADFVLEDRAPRPPAPSAGTVELGRRRP